MEYIERPAKVSRAEKQVLKPRNEQKNTEEQFEKIYNYLDEVKEQMDTPEEEIKFSEVLWENNSPTAEFKAQTINLKENNYKYFVIFARESTGNSTIHSQIIRAKDSFHLSYHSTYTPGGLGYIDFIYRNYCSSTQKSISFSDAKNFNTSSTTITTNNKNLIPVQVVGFN